MSVGPLANLAASIAATPLAQSKGSDVERAQHDVSNRERQIASETLAESAAGIGETNGENHATAERDADGRRLWEQQSPPAEKADSETSDAAQSKDASGESGRLIDLTG
jgi:hypothetical protein